jgi:hypothetical protein
LLQVLADHDAVQNLSGLSHSLFDQAAAARGLIERRDC